jgi:hypothetical protein
MDWLLEIALIVLLAITLFHAMRLERALGVLRRDRSALEELVAGFNASTRQAEQGIERLRIAADGAGRQIARQVEAATSLKDDLIFLSERGERLADRLDALVRAGRGLGPEPARAPSPAPAADYARDAMSAARRLVELVGESEPQDDERSDDEARGERPGGGLAGAEPRLPSKAERDLLRALRLPR